MTFRPLPLALAILTLVACFPAPALAQSCCAASQTAGPVRLSLSETAAMGLSLDARVYTGRFAGPDYRRLAHPSQEFRQTLFGGMRLGESWQIGATLPLIENHRRTLDDAEWGAGLGDLALQARYELVATGMSMRLPGLAIAATATLPTGRSPQQSIARGQSHLLSDVSGAGLWEVGAAPQVEWIFGKAFLAMEAGAYKALSASGLNSKSLRWSGRLSFGRPIPLPLFWDEALYLAASANITHGGASYQNGAPIPETLERATSLSVQAGAYLSESTYLMLRATWDLPFNHTGHARQVGPGAGLLMKKVFHD